MPSPCSLRCPAFSLPVLSFTPLSPFVSPSLSFAFAFWPSFSTSLMHSVSQSARLALMRASPCLSPPTSKSQPVGERLGAPLPPPRGGTGARPCGGRLRGRRHPAWRAQALGARCPPPAAVGHCLTPGAPAPEPRARDCGNPGGAHPPPGTRFPSFPGSLRVVLWEKASLPARPQEKWALGKARAWGLRPGALRSPRTRGHAFLA